MAKGKTSYTISFQANPQTVNEIVQSWLSANGFKLVTEEGIQVYLAGDGIITAKRYFEYFISGNQINMQAYLRSVKKPFALDSGLVGAVNTTPYISLIQELSTAIQNAPAQGNPAQSYNGQPQPQANNGQPNSQPQQYVGQSQPNSGQPQPYSGQPQQYSNQPQYGQQGFVQQQGASFQAMADKRISRCAVIALVLGIVNILLSLVGMSFGVIVIIIAYVLAVQGLKSSKRNLAIAAIVTTSISLVILLLEIVVGVLLY